MPSSRYVYADANQKATKGSMEKRRTSQHMRRNCAASNTDLLEETGDLDETILLSDEEIAPGDDKEGHASNSVVMDVEGRSADADDGNGNRATRHRPCTEASLAELPAPIRGGANSLGLSSDPLTSSTIDSTPSRPVRGRSEANGRINTKARLLKLAEQMGSDESDDDSLSDSEFMRAVARRQAERRAMLPKSQHGSGAQQPTLDSFRQVESMLQTQQQQQQSRNSDDTAMVHNRIGASSNNKSASESFAATQAWEKELDRSLTMKSNGCQQKAPPTTLGNGGEKYHPKQQDKKATSSSWPNDQQSDRHKDRSRNVGNRNRESQKASAHDQQNAPHQNSRLGRQTNQNAAQSNHRRQENEENHERQQPSMGSVPRYAQTEQRDNYQRRGGCPIKQGAQAASNSAPSFAQNDEQIEHKNHIDRQSNCQRQEHHSNNCKTQPDYRGEHIAGSGSIANPYDREQTQPPTKTNASRIVPKISLEHLKSGTKNGKGNFHSTSTHNNFSIRKSDGESWQEEAFRSSLLDLLGSFPANYFHNDDNSIDGNATSGLFATSAAQIMDDESPHSTTSQSAASAQLQRKRLFDAASRSLARLAIASRHSAKNNEEQNHRSSGGSNSSPDFNPPSPRSLPSFLSVNSIYDDSSPGYWAGNAKAMLSSSREVFCGHSVHGRTARTVKLSSIPQENGVPSSSPFVFWTLEELAYGSCQLAAQVCHEVSLDPNFDGSRSSDSESDSCRVAGFAQNTSRAGGNGKRPAVSSALMESSLGFLATAFACLESDLVYSLLRSKLKASGDINVTIFDTLCHFARDVSHDASKQDICTIPTLSLLTLSRGLEAALFVARYATSLDPSSACSAYSSEHFFLGGNTSGAIDTGIDEGGVGWVSAVGCDLGLDIEDNKKRRHLGKIACAAYDFILEFSPNIIDERCNDRNDQKSNKACGGLYIDTHTCQVRGDGNRFVCRQPSIMKDRIYSAHAEFISFMIQAGLSSDWVSIVPDSESSDLNEATCARTIDRLCQKLFFVIETCARLRRSTNQNTAANDPGDSEAVCIASLSLLIMALPKHVGQSAPSSLSASFRQMGGQSTGTLEDLFQSPLVRRLVEIGLSWKDESHSDSAKYHATNNAFHILSDICMAGGSSLISSHFHQLLDVFLQNLAGNLCKLGQSKTSSLDFPSIGCQILFIIQLHTGSALYVRQVLRNFFEQSSTSNDDYPPLFTSAILHIAADKKFSTSSYASSLLRILIEGHPVDQTKDRLSEIILSSFDTHHVSSATEAVIRSMAETTYSSVHCNISSYCIRWQPRLCSLGDLIGACTPSFKVVEIFSSSLSEEVLSLFVNVIECDDKTKMCVDTLCGSVNLSLLHLLASFANNDMTIRHNNNQDGSTILTRQRKVKEKLIHPSNFVAILELAMAQGTSADMTHRALKLHNSLMSLSNERSLALIFNKARNTLTRKECALRGKLAQSEIDLKTVSTKCQQVELERDTLSNSFHDQHLAFKRRLECTRSEICLAAKNVSELHLQERKHAEAQYSEEKQRRIKTEKEYEELKQESSSNKVRIEELEVLLQKECASRQNFESALCDSKNELSTISDALEQTSKSCVDLQEKLAASEEQLSDITATSENAQANLEDTCAKLIMLATIYQNEETETNNIKSDLRSAINSANKLADTAIQKYEYAKQQNKLLSKQLKEVTHELKEIKAHRADVQRMRKNAPVAYLNQLHNDPRIKAKKGRRVRPGKENSFDGR